MEHSHASKTMETDNNYSKFLKFFKGQESMKSHLETGKATGKITRISNDLYNNNMKIIKCWLLHFFYLEIILKRFQQQDTQKETHWSKSPRTGIRTPMMYAEKAPLEEMCYRHQGNEKAAIDSMNQHDRFRIPAWPLTRYVTLGKSFKFLVL